MKIKNFKILPLAALLIILSACDVFDATSEVAINPDQAFISEAAARSALAGVYDEMQNEDYYGAYFQYTSDNYVDVGDFQGFFQGFQAPDQGAIPSRNDNILNIWAQTYRTINAANEVIDKVPPLDIIGFEEEEKNEIIAQARGLRGITYLDLLTHFGEHFDLSSEFGLAIVSEANNGDLAQLQNPTRSSVSASYDFIIDDLEFAVANLPDSDDNGVLNKAAAQGILARALLHRGDYAGAISTATEVINKDNFALIDDVLTIYTTEGSAESLFELPYTTLDPSDLATFTISRDEVRPEPSLIASFTEGDARRALIDFVDGFNGERFIKAEDFTNQANPAYIIRMAEVYLIRAEAAFLDGDASNDGQALEDLNAVRTRAGLAPHEDATDFIDKLLDEYLWEFFAEGQRFRSLVRLGKLQEVIGLADFRRVYPIPQQELDVEGNNLTQNPNY
ncbi:MAG: RagB/SusD family nutrient uptake outer membrane protein [Bacteroidota bacterium]